VLDLGCGNGMLLAKLCEGRGDLMPYGVDRNPSALEHARQVLPEFGGSFTHGDLFDVALWDHGPNHYALALFMPGRLLEAPPDRARRVLDRLRSSCSRVLVYVYPDWAEEIDALALQLGLELETPNCGTAGFLKRPAATRAGSALNE
jgi:trans-aconitate methyltransferase